MTEYMYQTEIDITKAFSIPSDIKIIHHKKYILIIVPSCANWIVLEKESQLQIFKLIQEGFPISQIMSNILFAADDINFVVTQLVARRICTKKVESNIEKERNLHLFLTNGCNLHCPHCYMFSGKSEEHELTTDEIIKLITEYKTVANGRRITLSGGEPTIRNDFDHIVRIAAELGLEVKLLTNGSLLTRERIQNLSMFLKSVQISIDGFSEESNSRIRGKGHFLKALFAIEQFVKMGIETSVAITPSYEMLIKYTKEYISFANELAEKYSDKNFTVKFTENLSPGRNVNLTELQNEEYASLIANIQKEIYGIDSDFIDFVQTMSNDIIRDNCMFGVFSVSSNGDVYFCPEIHKLKPYANIRNSSFEDIYHQAINAEKATSVTQLQPCCDCELEFICGGGCRIEEFPKIAKLISFDIDKSNFNFSRDCNIKIKEKFYDLMIRSNEYLFQES